MRIGLSSIGALAAIAAMLGTGPAHEIVARSRPEPKKRRMGKSPALGAPYGNREERRAVRASKKHRLKGLRP